LLSILLPLRHAFAAAIALSILMPLYFAIDAVAMPRHAARHDYATLPLPLRALTYA